MSPKSRLSRRILKVAGAGGFILTVFAIPWGPGGPPRAQIEGECVMFCDDGNGYVDEDPYYGGGGGCATTDYDGSAAHYGGPTYVGEPHPEHPNVVYDGEYWQPAPGFEYVSDDPDDYRVRRIVGSYHPDHPNVVWNEDGWSPAEGFEWATAEPDDLTVVRTNGSSHPDHDNVVWDEDGWLPADGYSWVSDDAGDYRVVGVGDEHPDFPNTYWTGERWRAAEGYTWLNDDAGDYRVVALPAPEPEPEPELTEQTPLPTDGGLRIADVPSPFGYATAAERQAQLAALSDERIETELARIRRILERMQTDFDRNAADLQIWLRDAQQAEDDALKDSFGLLVGGSLDRFADVWDAYPTLKAIAADGLDLAGKLDQAIKSAENPADIGHVRELMRDKAMAAYKELVESGVEYVSENGPKAVELAKFLIDYSYHVTRWSLARDQILAINDNLDSEGGALKALDRIKRLQEDLIDERGRRQNLAS